MVPDKFNMVDMGGIDVVESQGVVVSGLYQRLVDSISNCRYQCLYNWKFDGVDIAPTYVELTILAGVVKINDYIWVTQDDIVHIYSIERQPVIESLSVNQNGIYTPIEGVDGFSPVDVEVAPVLQQIEISENGLYLPEQGVDGFSSVSVNVDFVPEDIFRVVAFSNSSGDKMDRGGRYFTRNSNEPAIILTCATSSNLEYTGYCVVSKNGITGTYSAYGDLNTMPVQQTPAGTSYTVQYMSNMFPPSQSSGNMVFTFAETNFTFTSKAIPTLLMFSTNDATFIGSQSLINQLYSLIDAVYKDN